MKRNSSLLLLAIGTALGVSVAGSRLGFELLATVPVVVGVALVLYYVSRINRIPIRIPLLLLGFYVGIVLLNLRIQTFVLAPDARHFEYLAWETVRSWTTSAAPPADYINFRVKSYVYVLAVPLLVLGRSTVALIILNVGFWVLTILVWVVIGREVFGIQKVGVLSVLLAIYPGGMIFSINVLREPLSLLLLSLSFLYIFRWVRTESWWYLLLATVSSTGSLLLRPELVLPLWFSVGVVVVSTGPDECRRQLLTLGSVMLTVGSVGMLVVLGRLPSYVNPNYIFDPVVLEIKREAHAALPHAYLQGMTYQSWIDILLGLPIRTVYFFLSPLPLVPSAWDLVSKQTLDALYIAVVLPCAVVGSLLHTYYVRVGRFDTRKIHPYLISALYFLMMMSGYSVVVSNVAAARRRFLIMPIAILFASIVVVRFTQKWRVQIGK